jgi:hypothetical protein
MASSKGAIFTGVMILVLVAYGFYYSYTQRASAAQQLATGAGQCAKVPSELNDAMQNLVDQQISSNNKLNPMDWFNFSRILSTAKSPMSLMGAGLSIEAITVLIAAWLGISTAFISSTAGWPPGMVFFFIINAGLGRGFSIATPYGADTTSGQVALRGV